MVKVSSTPNHHMIQGGEEEKTTTKKRYSHTLVCARMFLGTRYKARCWDSRAFLAWSISTAPQSPSWNGVKAGKGAQKQGGTSGPFPAEHLLEGNLPGKESFCIVLGDLSITEQPLV